MAVIIERIERPLDNREVALRERASRTIVGKTLRCGLCRTAWIVEHKDPFDFCGDARNIATFCPVCRERIAVQVD